MSKANDIADYGQFKPQRKNLIINGDMRVWQRGTTFTNTSSGFTVDRWNLTGVNSATMNVNKNSANAANVPFEDYIQLDVTTADTIMASADYSSIHYSFEGNDISGLKLGTTNAATVTLSFYTAHSKAGIYCVAFRSGSRGYVTEYTQAAASVWGEHSITVPLDTTGVWTTGTTLGMQLLFAFASGSSFNAAANTWTSGNVLSTVNQINALDSITNSIRFGGIQLEVGSIATDLEMRSYAEELARCQRYFQKPTMRGLSCFANGTAIVESGFPLPVRMRVSPTLIYTGPARFYDPAGTHIGVSATITDMGTDVDSAWFRQSGFTSLTSGSAGVMDFFGNPIEFDAEL